MVDSTVEADEIGCAGSMVLLDEQEIRSVPDIMSAEILLVFLINGINLIIARLRLLETKQAQITDVV